MILLPMYVVAVGVLLVDVWRMMIRIMLLLWPFPEQSFFSVFVILFFRLLGDMIGVGVLFLLCLLGGGCERVGDGDVTTASSSAL